MNNKLCLIIIQSIPFNSTCYLIKQKAEWLTVLLVGIFDFCYTPLRWDPDAAETNVTS